MFTYRYTVRYRLPNSKFTTFQGTVTSDQMLRNANQIFDVLRTEIQTKLQVDTFSITEFTLQE